MFTNVDDFLSHGVPQILAGVEKLHVLMASYNSVGDHESGPVNTGRDGLSITVQNGNLEYSDMTNLIFSSNPIQMALGSWVMHREGEMAQVKVESALQVEVPDQVPFVAFVYAGVSAFEKAVQMAKEVKRKHPTSKVIVTTCNCDLGMKARTLQPMLDSKEIEAVVVTPWCGGHEMMDQILRRLVEVWPEKVPA